MTTTSTADSKEGGVPDRPINEAGAMKPSGTQSAVKGEPSPRLPHEHDESSDSGKSEPTTVMRKAAADMSRGGVDQPRGPGTQDHYSDLTAQTAANPKK